ncbi:MAG TPA: (Fe-S)-binding protein [Hyphomicrobium sp.]|jgi:L-lactate dehydrogenase complex protein LldE
MTQGDSKRPRVALFVTCLVDLMRPSVGFAAVRLLEAAGCEVDVPATQTCCGQPAYNAGDRRSARALAESTMKACEGFDYVVAPSGSCAAILKLHYPRLFAGEPAKEARARAFAERVYELTAFLVDVRGLSSVPGAFHGRVACHDGCSGLRELKIARQPRALLAAVEGLELVELADPQSCCGFGGLFAVKYPDISNAIAARKTEAIAAAAPALVVSGELGCLMHLAGKLRRDGSSIACRHIAEVLAGETLAPAIAQAPAAHERAR